jgi:uncharacterized protein (DUF697 family)
MAKKLPSAIWPPSAGTKETGPAPAAPEPQRAAAPRPSPPPRPEPTRISEPYGDERRAFAVQVVERFALWSGAAALLPLPLIDLAVVGGVQIQLLRRLSQVYGVPFSANMGKALIASMAGSVVPATSGIGAASVLKGVPFVGTIASGFVMPALSAGATYAIGMAFIEHFASGGTLLDFKPDRYRDFVKAQKEMWGAKSAKR